MVRGSDLQESKPPSKKASKIACPYAIASNIEAVVENRRCIAGWRKSLYGARRTIAGGIFKASPGKRVALLYVVWDDVAKAQKSVAVETRATQRGSTFEAWATYGSWINVADAHPWLA
jgi:hypothetical protein